MNASAELIALETSIQNELNILIAVVCAIGSLWGAMQALRRAHVCDAVMRCWLVDKIYNFGKSFLMLASKFGIVTPPPDSPIVFEPVEQPKHEEEHEEKVATETK